MSIQSLLDKHDRRLSPQEFSLYLRGHFDFVVHRESDHEPEVAIEFDGFGHDDPRQTERDIIKNRLCAVAGLPLLRIGGAELQVHEQVTILEWLLGRFIAWGFSKTVRGDDIDPSAEGRFLHQHGQYGPGVPLWPGTAVDARATAALRVPAGLRRQDLRRGS